MLRLFTIVMLWFAATASFAQNTIAGIWHSPKTLEVLIITKGKTPQSIGKVYYAKQASKFVQIPVISQNKTKNQNELMETYYQAQVKLNDGETLDLNFNLSVAGEILERKKGGKKGDFGLVTSKFNEANIPSMSVKSCVATFLANTKFDAGDKGELTFKGDVDNLKVVFQGKEADVKLSPSGQIIAFNIEPWGAVKARLRVEGAWMLDINKASDDKNIVSMVAKD